MNFALYLARALRVGWICSTHLLRFLLDGLRKRRVLTGPERLRIALEQMSGSFLKFGQILSLQIDILPRDYCDALLDLLDRVPPFPREQVRDVFREELGRPPEELYREFDYKPMASASIGQVHRAVLKDGTSAAVKVQRPGIQQVFTRDAVLLRTFVKLIFFFRIRSLYFLRDPVQEFNEWIQDELDYRREAAYANMLEKNAQQTPSESIPKIHWPLTTARVLTMDFLQGYTVLEYMRMRSNGDQQRLAELKELGFDPSVFLSNVITNFVSDALRFGVFHADLHPANLLILKNNSVGYVDFGIVGMLTPEARRKVIQLTLAYVGGKTEEIYWSFLDISTLTKDVDLAGFRRELNNRTLSWYQEPAIAGIPRLGKTFNLAMIDLLTMCRSYGLLPNREMIKYIRSVVLADGLVSRLAPGLDYAPQLAELCQEYMARETQGKIISSKAALTLLADLTGWLRTGPGALLRALDMLERRQVRMQARFIERPAAGNGLRWRALLVMSIWLIVLVATARQNFTWVAPSLPDYLLIGFLGAWTLWLIYLLRQLVRNSKNYM